MLLEDAEERPGSTRLLHLAVRSHDERQRMTGHRHRESRSVVVRADAHDRGRAELGPSLVLELLPERPVQLHQRLARFRVLATHRPRGESDETHERRGLRPFAADVADHGLPAPSSSSNRS